MAVRTVEEWTLIADAVVLDVATQQLAFTSPELVAKAGESGWPGFPTVDPHHLTPALARLRAQGAIELHIAPTRGGQLQRAYTLGRPSKLALRAAGRKRLLASRYASWTSAGRDWNPSPIGAALERVLHRSLLEVAPYGYRLLNPENGEVREVLGARVPGGPLDNAAWYTALDTGGVPKSPTLVVIEAKNLREWIYPRTQELYQLLDKAVSLQVSHPGVRIVPVFVCRRAHFTTGAMAKQIGFHLITTSIQYVRPVVVTIDDGQRKYEEVVSELGYAMELHEDSVAPMMRQFREFLPRRLDEAADRWRTIALHPEVPDIVAALRDEELLGHERTHVRDELARCVNEVTGESVPWASAELD